MRNSHRGVAFTILKLGNGRCRWEIEPALVAPHVSPARGIIFGSTSDAAKIARAKIDARLLGLTFGSSTRTTNA